MTPAPEPNSYKATLYLKASLDAFVEEMQKAEDRLGVATSVVTKTEGNNLLHVAAAHGATEILKQLLDEIKKWTGFEGCKQALEAQNKRGNTPLHYAASTGSLEMCKLILSLESGDDSIYSLINNRNKQGETPLFLAALHGRRESFYFLHEVSAMHPTEETIVPWLRDNGDTILHCTISTECFDLSFQIIHMYKEQDIANVANAKGMIPLHVLANKPSAFRSGTDLPGFSKVLYSFTTVKPLQVESQSVVDTTTQDNKPILPKNYDTCHTIYGYLRHGAQRLLTGKTLLDLERNSSRGQITSLPPNYATWPAFLEYVCGICGYLHHIKSEKEKHVWGSQIMDELITEYYKRVPQTGLELPELMWMYDDISSSTDVKKDQQSQQGDTAETHDGGIMTPLLTATKNGVIEMVTKILKVVPLAIHESTADMKNILLVAAESRQPRIFRELKNHLAWENLIQAVDDKGNNVLHLAAQVSQFRPWRTPGSAMQMQWDIKWYQFMERNVPKHLIFQLNGKKEIPSDIFTKRRKQMLKDSSEWLKSCSQSCSVVATLIAGVSFATSCTVPGGTNSVTGKPTLGGEPAFNTFAITSLMSLCFSVTSLGIFLAILTSRQEPKDYRWDLPFKLLSGLSFLLASIASMLLSFYAAYFFMLEGRIHNVLFIIYTGTCLPMSVYAVALFPLYWDLLKAIVIEVPDSPCIGDLYVSKDAEEETSKKCICSCPSKICICCCPSKKCIDAEEETSKKCICSCPSKICICCCPSKK